MAALLLQAYHGLPTTHPTAIFLRLPSQHLLNNFATDGRRLTAAFLASRLLRYPVAALRMKPFQDLPTDLYPGAVLRWQFGQDLTTAPILRAALLLRPDPDPRTCDPIAVLLLERSQNSLDVPILSGRPPKAVLSGYP